MYFIVFLFSLCRNLQYIEADGTESFHTLKGYPHTGDLEKKVRLLNYFLGYMNDHLLKVFMHSLIPFVQVFTKAAI